MQLNQQVSSLKLSKKLKKLGVKQDGYFDWWTIQSTNGTFKKEVGTYNDVRYFGLDQEKECSAFTVAELGEMLPGNINGYPIMCQWGLMHNLHYVGNTNIHEVVSNTEADARAIFLIYLLENNLISQSSRES